MPASENTTLFVLANGRSIRAFRKEPEEPLHESIPVHLKEIPAPEISLEESGITENSDRPGRFDSGDRSGRSEALGAGENHTLSAEQERRTGKAIGTAISGLVTQQKPAAWCLVAPATWKSHIEGCLSKGDLAKLSRTEQGDWIRLPHADIEGRLLG